MNLRQSVTPLIVFENVAARSNHESTIHMRLEEAGPGGSVFLPGKCVGRECTCWEP